MSGRKRFQRDAEIIKKLALDENYLKTREFNNIFGPHFTKNTDGLPNPIETAIVHNGITRIRGGEKVISPVSYLPFNISPGSYRSPQEQEISLKPKPIESRTGQTPTRQPAQDLTTVSAPVPEISDMTKQSDYEYNKQLFERDDQAMKISEAQEKSAVKQHRENQEKPVLERQKLETEMGTPSDISYQELKMKGDPDKEDEERTMETVKLESEERTPSSKKGETSNDAPQDTPEDTPEDEDKHDNAPEDNTPEGTQEEEIPYHDHTIIVSSNSRNKIKYDNGNGEFTYGAIQIIRDGSDIKSIRFMKSGKNSKGYVELEPSEKLSLGERRFLSDKIIELFDVYTQHHKYPPDQSGKIKTNKNNINNIHELIKQLITEDSKLVRSSLKHRPTSKYVYSGSGMRFTSDSGGNTIVIEDQILPELVNALGSLHAGNVSEEIINKIVFLAQQAYERGLISKEQYVGLMNSLVK